MTTSWPLHSWYKKNLDNLDFSQGNWDFSQFAGRGPSTNPRPPPPPHSFTQTDLRRTGFPNFCVCGIVAVLGGTIVVLGDCQQKYDPRMKYKEGKLFPSFMFQTLQWYSTAHRVKFESKVPHHLAPACLSPLDSSRYRVYGASWCFSNPILISITDLAFCSSLFHPHKWWTFSPWGLF